MLRFIHGALCAILGSLFAVQAVAADTFPNRPIRLIVPFSPGGGTDISARILSKPLGETLGTTIVVDNRPGAGTIIGTSIAIKAEPDGYTLFLGTISVAVNPAIYKKLPYDVQKDLAPISRVSTQPSVIVVHPSFPAKTIKEFLTMARAKPDAYNFGSPGFGTAGHLAAELLWQKVGAKLVHIPFKGTGPALNALLGNQITVYMSSLASALPHIEQRRLRALAVSTAKRAGPLPNVPTLKEEGVDFEYGPWYGLFAPIKTPKKLIDQINKATLTALKSPELLHLFERQGLLATPTTPQEFAEYIASEKAKWAVAARTAKIPMQ